MPRGRPAKGTTRGAPPKAQSDEAVPEEKPAQDEKKGNSRMRTRIKAGGERQSSLDESMKEQKKRGRKRKSLTIPDTEKSEKGTDKSEASMGAHESKEEEATEVQKEIPQQEGEIRINRAPVLTLWVAVVAEREGYKFEEGLTFGKAISGLYAHSKGRRLGVFEEPSEESSKKKRKKEGEKFEVFGSSLYGKTTDKGLRLAVQDGRQMSPATVNAYLQRAFHSDFDRVKAAMETLANSVEPEKIGGEAYHLYEKFRPSVPEGTRGWGAKGVLDLNYIQGLATA